MERFGILLIGVCGVVILSAQEVRRRRDARELRAVDRLLTQREMAETLSSGPWRRADPEFPGCVW